MKDVGGLAPETWEQRLGVISTVKEGAESSLEDTDDEGGESWRDTGH